MIADPQLSGRKRADDLNPDRDLIDLDGTGTYRPFRRDQHPSGWVILRTSVEVRPVTPFAGVRFINRHHASDLIAEARW